MQELSSEIEFQNLPILIVGQGLAGSILAYHLIQNDQKVVIFDAEYPSSSAVAAGIFNPVTGKKLVKTWLADETFAYLFDFYAQLENDLNTAILHKKSMYRPFLSIEQQTFQTALTADHPSLLDTQVDHDYFSPYINNTLGGVMTLASGWVDVAKLLDRLKSYYQEKRILKAKTFDFEQIKFANKIAFYEDEPFRKIIFCEGTYATQNPYFTWLPFQPVRGEILTVRIDAIADLNYVINQGIFVIPLGQNLYKVGATYDWANLNWEITEGGKLSLIEKLKLILKVEFEVIGQVAGVRPANVERRPFIGLHPRFETLGIFNGFGSKGVSLVPFFAKQFSNFLTKDQHLDSLVNINRYFSLTC